MTETDDPHKALQGKSIADRAAGARDLSQVGEVKDLELLAAVAATDRSPGVRLSAAAAAADILSRHRVGEAAKKIGPKKRRRLAELFRKIDPSVNAGVFSVFGCLDTSAALEAICGGLRDPRGDIRLGAAVGLLRLCTSGAVAGKAKTERVVSSLLTDGRHKPDALAEIARICAAADYRRAFDDVRALALSGAHGELVAEALEVFELGTTPLSGLWFSDGKDAGETNPSSPMGAALALIGEKQTLVCEVGTWRVDKSFGAGPVRRMHFRRVGAAESGPAFQVDGRTWYEAGSPETLCILDALTQPGQLDWTDLPKPSAAAKKAAAEVGACLPDDSVGHRGRALLLARAGDAEAAIAELTQATDLKNVFPDTWVLLADAQWAAGNKKSAKANYATFVKKARKKDGPEAYERAKSRAG
jgi:hypothetical protein